MTHLARLVAAATVAVALAACTGADSPTLPDVERTPTEEGAGLDEDAPAGAEDDAPPDDAEPNPGQSPIDQPDDPQPGGNG